MVVYCVCSIMEDKIMWVSIAVFLDFICKSVGQLLQRRMDVDLVLSCDTSHNKVSKWRNVHGEPVCTYTSLQFTRLESSLGVDSDYVFNPRCLRR